MVPDTIDDRRSKGPARKDYRIMYENGHYHLNHPQNCLMMRIIKIIEPFILTVDRKARPKGVVDAHTVEIP